MVGITRARGCETCRKRKIRCGLEQPSCAQCIKSKRVCAGYRRYPIFIQHTVTDGTKAESAVRHETANLSSRTGATAQQQQAETSKPIETPTVNTDSLLPLLSLSFLVGHINPHPALRQQLLEEYLSLYCPKAHLGPMQRRLWLFQLPIMPHMNLALEVSMMALCVAKLSDVYHDPTLRYESLRLYHRGIHQLQKALWDPKLMYHEQTLAACIALATYEMSQCPNESKQGYVSHTSGCEKLIQLRGPDAHTDGLAHQVFVQFRIQGILYALDTQQSTFLSDSVWQKVPWRKNPKTVFDQVYDFVIIAPELHRQGAMLKYMDPGDQLRLATEMIAKCWKMDGDLASFYDRLVKSHTGPLYWPQLACGYILDEDKDDELIFPVAFHFANLSVASTVLVFWACQAMLWQGMIQLYRLMDELRDTLRNSSNNDAYGKNAELMSEPQADTKCFDLPALEHRADFAAPARNIFQSVEYCLMDEMKDHGPKTIAASLRIAMEILRPHAPYRREMLWAEEAMAKIQARSLRLLVYYTGG
ncbi:hypothetical protein A1O1_08309 [Capronia coronata CBS 617.96]|uniref:Zn(2)-C6 fungal-type domain-containing protein n=1 Tax=Capronia coronata CBS 617.96 TaxID=1182541 RepID=W9XI14_9EURO|nr:uncharacterized protein A1O1_08309 [Capronia coronata CBS 617.96]EXJ80167.1 hypothetical protein A1O1_08309 [Capronia coronata CBS 617.96]